MRHYDVAVVGMGPVGSAAAIFLAHAGLKVVTVERDPEVYALPRAVGMDGEVIRAFQRIGIGQPVADLMQAVQPGDRAGFANSQREWLFGADLGDFGNNGWPPISMFDQPEFDRYLRDYAADHSNVTSYSGFDFKRFTDDGQRVSCSISPSGLGIENKEEVETSDDSLEFSVSYVLACDGASSGIRKRLNIPWRDLGYDHDWLVVDVIVNSKHTLNRDTVQVCSPDRLATYVCTKDPYRRWEFKLNDGERPEDMVTEESIRTLLDPWTPRDSYTIRRKAVYQFHAAIAEEWSRGRVFLVGDAAHQTPPFLGQGMNAGMRDAINIAWKLSLVLSGSSDPSLLTQYQAERAAHAQDLVQWAVDFGKLMEQLAATEDAQNRGIPVPEVETQDKNQSSGYGQGREAPPLRDGVIIVEQVSNEGSTGYLFSQPMVKDNSDNVFLLDEKLDQDFTIVVRTESEIELNEISRSIISRLGMTIISLEDFTAVRGHFDRLFTGSQAVVVRPDRYVFGHTSDQLDLNQLLAQLADKLHLEL